MTQQRFALGKGAQRAVLASWLSSALAVSALVIPKCPLCVAAYLCVFGVSASSAQLVAELGAPLCLAGLACSALATALLVARNARRSPGRRQDEPTCCAPRASTGVPTSRPASDLRRP